MCLLQAAYSPELMCQASSFLDKPHSESKVITFDKNTCLQVTIGENATVPGEKERKGWVQSEAERPIERIPLPYAHKKHKNNQQPTYSSEHCFCFVHIIVSG